MTIQVGPTNVNVDYYPGYAVVLTLTFPAGYLSSLDVRTFLNGQVAPGVEGSAVVAGDVLTVTFNSTQTALYDVPTEWLLNTRTGAAAFTPLMKGTWRPTTRGLAGPLSRTHSVILGGNVEVAVTVRGGSTGGSSGTPDSIDQTEVIGLVADLASKLEQADLTAHAGAVDPHGDRAYTNAQIAAVTGSLADWRAAVQLATTANVTLSGEQTIDGTLTAASRVLVKDQTTGSQNGVYVTAAGAWTRATDFDASAEATAGATFAVTSGTVNGGRIYTLTTPGATLGTTALVFTSITAGTVLAANNGSDFASPATTLTNLGGVPNTGTSTINGTKTFGTIPLIPTTVPTLGTQVISKSYLDSVLSSASAGGPTVLVAASNAPTVLKNRADYVCSGAGDEVEFNAALALGGTVQYTDGTYNTDAPINVQFAGQKLIGPGPRYIAPGGGGGTWASTLAGALIRPSASFVGTHVIKVERNSDSYILPLSQVSGVAIDGQLAPAGVSGILFRVFRGVLYNFDIQYMPEDGVTVVGNEGANPAWSTYDTRIYSFAIGNCGGIGLNLKGTSGVDTHIAQGIIESNRVGIFLGGASHQIVSVHTYTNSDYNIESTGGGSRTKFGDCKIEHSGKHGVYLHGATSNPVQLQFDACNFSSNGETTHNTYDHINVSTTQANQLTVTGCTFATTDGAVNIARYAINLGTGLNTGNLAPSSSLVGNTINANSWATQALNIGSGSATEQTIELWGNPGIQNFSGSTIPTATIQVAAGTTGAATIGGGSRNERGSVTITPNGTGITSGEQVRINLPTSEIPRPGGATASAQWVPVARSVAGANLQPYIGTIAQTSSAVTSFMIGFGVAPVAGTAYVIGWVMVA